MATPTSEAGREMDTTTPRRHSIESPEYVPGGVSGPVADWLLAQPGTDNASPTSSQIRGFIFMLRINPAVHFGGLDFLFQRSFRAAWIAGNFIFLPRQREGHEMQCAGNNQKHAHHDRPIKILRRRISH